MNWCRIASVQNLEPIETTFKDHLNFSRPAKIHIFSTKRRSRLLTPNNVTFASYSCLCVDETNLLLSYPKQRRQDLKTGPVVRCENGVCRKRFIPAYFLTGSHSLFLSPQLWPADRRDPRSFQEVVSLLLMYNVCSYVCVCFTSRVPCEVAEFLITILHFLPWWVVLIQSFYVEVQGMLEFSGIKSVHTTSSWLSMKTGRLKIRMQALSRTANGSGPYVCQFIDAEDLPIL